MSSMEKNARAIAARSIIERAGLRIDDATQPQWSVRGGRDREVIYFPATGNWRTPDSKVKGGSIAGMLALLNDEVAAG